jgi:hypothetical protein
MNEEPGAVVVPAEAANGVGGVKHRIAEWRDELLRDPDPLTRAERVTLLTITLITAISRWLALARSAWDWDEMLFQLAMQHYNVAQHRPHPPGFPLYVGAAKLVALFGVSDFHALQTINFICAVAIVPATFLLARELRFRVSAAFSAAVLLAFFPNVWVFGGTAFSDVPSMLLITLAVGLLLRGCRSTNAYLLGTLVAGVAAGFRSQNAVIAALPLLIAFCFHARRRTGVAIAGLLIPVVIGAASYGTAALLTGVPQYREAIALHEKYVTQVDSFRSPDRPPLRHLVDDFFLRPYRIPRINVFVSVLMLLSLLAAIVRRRANVLLAIAMFAPFMLLAWLMLDVLSISRFSIGYAPAIALLAGDGTFVIGSVLAALLKRPRVVPIVVAVITAWATGMMISWMMPALRVVRTTDSPPIAAASWIRAHVPRSTTLYVHEGMSPYSEYLLPDYTKIYVFDKSRPTTWTLRDHGMFLSEFTSSAADAVNFTRTRKRLADVVRERYFEVTVMPVTALVDFGDGWYAEEGVGEHSWRWMQKRGEVSVPPVRGKARLQLELFIPLDILTGPPTITVTLNGRAVDSFVADKQVMLREYVVDALPGHANALTIETSEAVQPAAVGKGGEERTLGLKLQKLRWTRVER